MYFHVRISQKSKKTHDETKVDLSEEELNERYIKPYKQGLPIIINGKTITPDDIERIRISRSEQPSQYFIKIIEAEDRNNPVIFIGGSSSEWKAADRAKDITDERIIGPPGYSKNEAAAHSKGEDEEMSTTKIFVVHGHDQALKNDTEIFLRDVGLEPIILHRQPDKGLTIIEKFEEYSDVNYALILLTPDDIGYAISEQEKKEEDRTINFRARQNVIFELGYFIGKLGRSNVFYVFKEGVEIPSDITGLIYKKVNESIGEVGYDLIKEFQTSGMEPKI